MGMWLLGERIWCMDMVCFCVRFEWMFWGLFVLLVVVGGVDVWISVVG